MANMAAAGFYAIAANVLALKNIDGRGATCCAPTHTSLDDFERTCGFRQQGIDFF